MPALTSPGLCTRSWWACQKPAACGRATSNTVPSCRPPSAPRCALVPLATHLQWTAVHKALAPRAIAEIRSRLTCILRRQPAPGVRRRVLRADPPLGGLSEEQEEESRPRHTVPPVWRAGAWHRSMCHMAVGLRQHERWRCAGKGDVGTKTVPPPPPPRPPEWC